MALFLIAPVSVAKAETPKPTLAILDTALDSSIPAFKGRITQEVCIIQWSSCANGKDFQEGPGAASMPANLISLNGFDHGTQMASIALAQNPNMNIVFVRIIGATPTGVRQITNPGYITKAFDWVIQNKDKYNIQAVSMSQGNHTLLNATEYCPSSPDLVAKIKQLIGYGIPSFFSTGNSRDYKKIDWPSCLTDSISVAASTDQDEIAIYSNVDTTRTDFVAFGSPQAIKPGNVVVPTAGTSAATQIAAASWIAFKQSKPNVTYQDEYNVFVKTSKKIIGPGGTFGNLINLKGALNG